jgi:hypothetical protein
MKQDQSAPTLVPSGKGVRITIMASGLVILLTGFGFAGSWAIQASETGPVVHINIDRSTMGSCSQDTAFDMAVVVDGGTVGGISLIDPVTDTAFGPFLQGQPPAYCCHTRSPIGPAFILPFRVAVAIIRSYLRGGANRR